MADNQPQDLGARVKLPTQEWERIPGLAFIATDGAEFEAAREKIQQQSAGISALIDGDAGALVSALREYGASVRPLIEDEGGAPVGESLNPDQKRVAFLWGTSYLLESISDALESLSAQGDGAEDLRENVRQILGDVASALAGTEPGDGGDEDGAGAPEAAPKCSTCYPTYQKCTLPPATCQANYYNCLNNCTP